MRHSLFLILAALWVSSGLCVAGTRSTLRGCDNAKFLIKKDLPPFFEMWNCPLSPWPESTQQQPNIDTQHHILPAKPVCMDTPIRYNVTVPSSGPYRPLGAQSGEYLYCPPQRWLNNLKHGATVLLYHPCTPLRQRLSFLTRSCLSDYVITSDPDLSPRRPLVFVSWGRTLELSTLTSSDVCDWLEATAINSNHGDVVRTRKYNLLLIHPARQHQNKPVEGSHLHLPNIPKQSIRHCCEQILAAFRDEILEEETERKERSSEKVRRRRKAVDGTIEEEVEREKRKTVQEKQLDDIIERRQSPGGVRNQTEPDNSQSHILPPQPGPANRTREPSVTEPPSEPIGSGPTATPVTHDQNPTHSENQKQDFTSKSILTPTQAPLSTRAAQEQVTTTGHDPTGPGLTRDSPGPEGPDYLRATVKQPNQKPTPSPVYSKASQALQINAALDEQNATEEKKKMEGERKKEKNSDRQNTMIRNGKLAEVTDRKPTRKRLPTNRKNSAVMLEPPQKPQPEPQAQPQNNPSPPLSQPQPKPEAYHQHTPSPPTQPKNSTCTGGGCNGHCKCPESSSPLGGSVEAGLLANGMPRTPRTDEAVWAAAALGFLLVLLVLSVLHTRLYRHWRTSPSLYWHDPRQDYDSVGDVIRRRLKIAERKRKRRSSFSRRHEVSLLPNSSTDEDQ